MNPLFKYLTGFVVMATSVLTNATAAQAESVPRAWLVVKGDSRAVLAGESHFGTPLEFDAYYHSVLLPSFAVSQAALMETYIGPEQQEDEGRQRGTPCMAVGAEHRQQRLRPAFDALTAATRANALAVPNWMASWQILPEFFFTSLYLDRFVMQSLGPSYVQVRDGRVGTGVSFRLRASGAGPKAASMRGLDTLKHARDSFCSASASDRQDFVADRVLMAAALLRHKQTDPQYSAFGTLAEKLGKAVEKSMRCIDSTPACSIEAALSTDDVRQLQQYGWMNYYSAGTFEISVKQRNLAWVPLITKTIMSNRKTMIVVGSLHVPDWRVGDTTHPGLITLLRQQGFQVSPIHGPGDIQEAMLTRSWAERMFPPSP